MPLEAVMSGEAWTEVYDRLAELVREHRTTLVFVNTRRLAERVARHLSERIGEEFVTAHHGSLARDRRLDAEQRLKRGELKALVATASLELGIDIGDVDLVCQIGSTRSINAFLQRVGRAGHSVGGISKGRLFPLSRDELVECTALLDAVRRGELDRLEVPQNLLDVLTQQIAAEVSAQEWSEDALFELHARRIRLPRLAARRVRSMRRHAGRGLQHAPRTARSADPPRRREQAAAPAPRRAPDRDHLGRGDSGQCRLPRHAGARVAARRDRERGLRGREPARRCFPTRQHVLSDLAGGARNGAGRGCPRPTSVDSVLAGRGAGSERRTVDGRLAAPRAEIEERLVGKGADATAGMRAASEWVADALGVDAVASSQLIQYLAAGRAALGTLPKLDTIVFERFFDESGGMQLVIHSPYGSRVNRAWGLALRKRFCRTFNFELQAAATEDHIILSLTHAHSFELAEVSRYLNSKTARHVLIQALCAAPMFAVRWRWDAGIALALPRFRGGKKIPPQIARMNAEDLLASVFPDQVACAENLPGEIEVPDNPLVRQTIRDCLEDAMNVEAFEALLRGLESGAVRVVARDLTEPSPLALEALDRASLCLSRRCAVGGAAYPGGDEPAMDRSRFRRRISDAWTARPSRGYGEEAWPDAATADELHDALLWLTFLTRPGAGRELPRGLRS